MAINYELLNKGIIPLGGNNFQLLGEVPLDSRLVVPTLDGLQNLIDNAAAYEGMIVYVSSEKKHYEVKVIDGVLSYRQFGLTETELNDLITSATTAAMEFKGAAATLPENPAKGDMYKVAGENIDIEIDGVGAIVGDSIVYDGEKWFLIPSGDDIEDTWRPVEGVNNDATLKFVDGDKTVATVAADGTIKYNHATVAAPANVTAEGDEKTRTYITAVETDGYGHITGYKTATENVEDTNTTYEFEGLAVGEDSVAPSSVYFNVTSSEEGATEQTIYVDAYSKNEADGKFVAKEAGKSLISDAEIARLAEVDNYDDEEVRGLIGDNAQAIEDLERYVGTIPTDEKYANITNVISYVNKKAEETLAAAQGGSSETAASVKQQLDNYNSENDTRVKAIEDAIDADPLHSHANKDELDKIADGDVAKWNAAEKNAKDYADVALAKKVDNETYTADKATFATKTELNGVDAKFANYKTAEAQKVIDDAQDVEIAKKVDKVDGKSLVDDAEITKLAGVSEGANRVEASTNGKIKIDGVDTTVYVHPEKHTVSEISDFDASVKAYDYATKTEAQAMADGKDEAIAAALKAGTDAQGEVDALEAYVGTFTASEGVDTVVKYIDAKTANIASDERVSGIENRVKAIEDEYLVEADKTELAGLVTAEKERAEGIEGGLRTDINTVMGDYLKAADKTALEGKITAEETRAKGVEESLQTQINTIMSNPDAEGAINSINEFTQYVKDHGTIADGFRVDIDKNKDDIAELKEEIGIPSEVPEEGEAVEATGLYAKIEANAAKIEANAARIEAAKQEALDDVAQDISDINNWLTNVSSDSAAIMLVLHGNGNGNDGLIAKVDVNAEAIEAAKTEAATNDAAVLAEAKSYADGTKAAAVADAEGKVNALANNVYTKEQTYTQAEVDALISAAYTWGEF